jgi:hypothetical protein
MIATKKKVDFRQLASKKTVLFVSTSAVNSSLHCLINIFYAQAFQTLFEYAESLPNGRLPIPVHVLCDDFAVGSRIQNFPEYVSVFRESRISATILVQSESQLESMYGINDATTIINNCDTYIYLVGQDLKTCRSISQRLNLPLEDVLYMPIGQEFIFRRGQKPIITNRYDIRKNKLYGQITEEYEKKDGRQRPLSPACEAELPGRRRPAPANLTGNAIHPKYMRPDLMHRSRILHGPHTSPDRNRSCPALLFNLSTLLTLLTLP